MFTNVNETELVNQLKQSANFTKRMYKSDKEAGRMRECQDLAIRTRLEIIDRNIRTIDSDLRACKKLTIRAISYGMYIGCTAINGGLAIYDGWKLSQGYSVKKHGVWMAIELIGMACSIYSVKKQKKLIAEYKKHFSDTDAENADGLSTLKLVEFLINRKIDEVLELVKESSDMLDEISDIQTDVDLGVDGVDSDKNQKAEDMMKQADEFLKENKNATDEFSTAPLEEQEEIEANLKLEDDIPADGVDEDTTEEEETEHSDDQKMEDMRRIDEYFQNDQKGQSA